MRSIFQRKIALHGIFNEKCENIILNMKGNSRKGKITPWSGIAGKSCPLMTKVVVFQQKN